MAPAKNCEGGLTAVAFIMLARFGTVNRGAGARDDEHGCGGGAGVLFPLPCCAHDVHALKDTDELLVAGHSLRWMSSKKCLTSANKFTKAAKPVRRVSYPL